jgi:hypothetical protein
MEKIEMKQTQADIDWQDRILCSDENCIGVIGPDNRCKECGRPSGSKPEEEESPDVVDKGVDPVDDPADFEKEEAETIPPPSDDDWDNRVLCSDESCIGVIGPDGRCKECGLS